MISRKPYSVPPAHRRDVFLQNNIACLEYSNHGYFNPDGNLTFTDLDSRMFRVPGYSSNRIAPWPLSAFGKNPDRAPGAPLGIQTEHDGLNGLILG